MDPILDSAGSIYVKCNYSEMNHCFEGHLQRDLLSLSSNREMAVASVNFLPKSTPKNTPIEIGVSFGRDNNLIQRIDKGIIMKILILLYTKLFC